MSSILDRFKLDGKVAVVTGASRGLGQGMAIALAEAGADITAVDVIDCTETIGIIKKLGRKTVSIQTDLCSQGTPQKIVDQTVAGLGRLDILVNNAGIIRRADFLEFSEKDWDDVMNVNLRAVFRLSQRFAAALAARRAPGRIINTASLLSFQGGVRVASYAAAKSALAGLTRAMANELAPLGINVNAVAPGYMETDNTAPLRADPARHQAILERIPAGRWGTGADLKGAVVFLASPASAYVHGVTLPVDGGWLAR